MRSSRILFVFGMLALLALALYLRRAHREPAAESPPPRAAVPDESPASRAADEQDEGGETHVYDPDAPAPRRRSRPGAPQPPDYTIHYDDASAVPALTGRLGELCYEAALARVPPSSDGGDEELWAAWLELVPGAGDRLLCGRVGRDGPGTPTVLGEATTARGAPQLAAGEGGGLWLGEEEETAAGGWDVFVRHAAAPGGGEDAGFGPRLRVSQGAGADVDHVLAADPPGGAGGVWVVWRSDVGGELAILARHVVASGGTNGAPATLTADAVQRLSAPGRDAWAPAVTVDRAGRVFAAWDAYTGESFDVLARVRDGESWRATTAVAVGPAFQVRPQLASDSHGRTWILWEEGAPRWGAPFTATKEITPGPGNPTRNELRDDRGPLHRFRELELAVLEPDGRLARPAAPLPLPAVEAGESRPKKVGIDLLGTYYERGRLCIDGAGRPWVLYRHGSMPTVANLPTLPNHFFAEGFRVYGRCLAGDAWSELLRLELPQRDGMQRLAAAPLAGGCLVAWTVGRDDRYHLFAADGSPIGDDVRDPPHGVCFARLEQPVPPGGADEPVLLPPASVPLPATAPPPPELAPATVGGVSYRAFLGDLHRHTDLSFCNSFLDASLADTYRYAIDVARLGFLAITDHTWDLDRGLADGLNWWRSTKEIGRERVAGRFAPFLGFERSDRDTDHNFVSLSTDLAFHHPAHGRENVQPLPDLWRSLDDDTLCLPHTPFEGHVWDYQDDAKRPLLEIWQGFRSEVSEGPAREGLARGYHLGFVASSDHLSTSASYACVWAPGADRTSIFRSLQARRTWAATDRIRVLVHAGEHWMGERLPEESSPELAIEIDGTAPLAKVEVVRSDGPDVALTADPGSAAFRGTWQAPAPAAGAGERWAYVHVVQEDGGEAWSSPLWFGRPR